MHVWTHQKCTIINIVVVVVTIIIIINTTIKIFIITCITINIIISFILVIIDQQLTWHVSSAPERVEPQRLTAEVARGPWQISETPLWSNGFDRKHPSPFLGQFSPGLHVRVKETKVADDDGNRQGYCQDARQGANGPHQHAHVRLRRHVTVPDRRHGDDGPPEAHRYGREVVLFVGLGSLGVEDQRGEDDDEEDEEEDQE